MAEGESGDEVWQLATSTPTARKIESMHSFARKSRHGGMVVQD